MTPLKFSLNQFVRLSDTQTICCGVFRPGIWVPQMQEGNSAFHGRNATHPYQMFSFTQVLFLASHQGQNVMV